MKKISGLKITRHDAGDGFSYLVEEDRDGFEAWIGLEGYGIMDFSIGVSKAYSTREGFLDLLELSADEDKAFYLFQHEELEYTQPALYEKYAEEIYEISQRVAETA